MAFELLNGIDSQLRILDELLYQIYAMQRLGENFAQSVASGSSPPPPLLKNWLEEVQNVENDLGYLRTDLEAFRVMRRNLKEEVNKKKVFKFISNTISNAAHNYYHDRFTSIEINDIQCKLRQLKRTMEFEFGLILHDRYLLTEPIIGVPIGPRVVDETRIVGRNHDKEVLLNLLLRETPTAPANTVTVLSIAGMAGIGKSTIAKMLYNDNNVKEHFEIKAWVSLDHFSLPLDMVRLIFAYVCKVSVEVANKTDDLDLLLAGLNSTLRSRRFLFVLDDFRGDTYDEVVHLGNLFCQAAAPGSKIIVTTRFTGIIPQPPHSLHILDALSSEASASLLILHAPNLSHSHVLREGILKICRGLPLALESIGSWLSCKSVENLEELLRNREMWLWQVSVDILDSLRKRYYECLAFHIEKLLLFFSLYPHGYVFDSHTLLLVSMAEGFIDNSFDDTPMRILVCEPFKILLSHSYLYHPPGVASGYSLHPFLHQLSKCLAKKYYYMLHNEMDMNENNASLNTLRHFSFLMQEFGVYRKFKALQGARRLRTFIAIGVDADDSRSFHLSKKVLLELLPQLKYLRVLSLNNYSITTVPQSIGSLKHMRYLNFSRTNITCLPEQVCDLYYLQVLLLRGCEKLVRLPKRFTKLVNLRHLDIYNTPMLEKLPSGIGEMTSLQFLSKVLIERSNGFKISNLKGMILRGRLSIEGLHKVKDARQAEEADLQQKKGLDDLVMEWSDVFDDSRNEVNEYEVLEKLKPHYELIGLKILFYGGTHFPSWVGDSTFSQLTQLTLRGCQNCNCLPTLGFLESLKKLSVESMPKVECIRCDLFPSLEVLEFEDMQGWKIWSINNGDSDGRQTSFPRLYEISIVDCPELAQMSVGKMASLRVIRVGRCSEVVLRSMVGASSSIISLKMDGIIGLNQLDGEVLQHLGVVEHLCISKCHTMEYLWELKSRAPNYLANLQKLEVRSCKKLASLEKTADEIGITMEKLTEVSLADCEKLQSYTCQQNIKKLVIHNCQSIKELSFPPGQNLSLNLDIQRCHSLKEFWADNFVASNVNSLEMDNLPNLRTFPEEFFKSLTTLMIRGCDNIHTIPDNVFVDIPLCHLEIISCRNIKSFPHMLLEDLVSLKEMLITNCPLMDSFPCCSWPPHLSILRIGRLRKPMSEWGHQNLPKTLHNLCLLGENSGVVTFPDEDEQNNDHATSSSSTFVLPKSLSTLEIIGFRHLESLSKGLNHLKSLEHLVIESCPHLGDLPETLLSSLSSLKVSSSLKLQERCRGYKKADYGNLISEIAEVDV